MSNKERKVGEVLKQQKHEVDASAVWSSIAADLPKQDERRIGFWWLLFLLIPVVVGAYYLYDPSNNESQRAEQQEVFVETKIHQDSKLKRKGGVTMDRMLEKTALVEVPHSDEKLTIRKEENITGSSERKEEAVAISQDVSDGKPSQNADKVHARNSQTKLPVHKPKNKEEKYLVLPMTEQRATSRSLQMLPIVVLSIEGEEVVAGDVEMQLNNHLTPVLGCNTPKFGMLMLAGLNQSFDQIQGMESRETGLLGASLSGSVEYYTQKRWIWRLGVGYDNYVSRYENKSTIVSSALVDDVSEVLIDAQGFQTSTTGKVTQVAVTNNDIIWHRHHRALDIELIVQKRFPLNHRLSTSLSGGMAYNLWTGSRGYGYLNDEIQEVQKFENDPGFYKVQAGLKPLLGLEISYTVRKVEILLNANYKWNLEPINTQTNIYQQKHSQTGIQLGTRYYLNGNKNKLKL